MFCLFVLSHQFDGDQYSEVRYGPRYTPKQQRGASPPPAKPVRTDRPDYDTTAAAMSRDYDSTRGKGSGGGGGGGGGGLAELDNLLDMLSDTQSQQGESMVTCPLSYYYRRANNG